MRPNSERAITLVELIISIVLLGMVMLGFYGIELFSRQQFLASDKRARVQNEAMYVLSHINKNILGAIGDEVSSALNITGSGANTSVLRATIDSFSDGVKNYSTDSNISYCFNDANCNAAAAAYTINYNPNISAATPPSGEVISKKIRAFNATQNGNCLNVSVSACWDPAQTAFACGTLENPAVNMTNIIRMPSVSAQ